MQRRVVTCGFSATGQLGHLNCFRIGELLYDIDVLADGETIVFYYPLAGLRERFETNLATLLNCTEMC